MHLAVHANQKDVGSTKKGTCHLVECPEQLIDLGARGLWAHQHHVVKRRDDAAPIEKPEVDHLFKLGSERASGLRSVSEKPGSTDEFDSGSDARHVPW
jgi:hypothetical protein